MKTEVLPVTEESLRLAADILKAGGLVAFPTETVYGLGADARNDAAVKEIFAVKGRPQDNPLIVHVHKDYDISGLVEASQEYVSAMFAAFTPGPITMVMKSKGAVSPAVSCGLDSVGIRVPQSPAAQAFLRAVDLPIAAPSANRSKHTSPVTAQHVLEDFDGKIPLILDGGRCSGGIESTVVNVMEKVPVVLRAGLVTAEQIAAVAGSVRYAGEKEPVRSPGMKYRHYHPACRTAMFAKGDLASALKLASEERAAGSRVYFLADAEAETLLRAAGESLILSLGKTDEEVACNVYFKLHEAEKVCDLLIAFSMEEKGVMVGVMNRLKKACAPS